MSISEVLIPTVTFFIGGLSALISSSFTFISPFKAFLFFTFCFGLGTFIAKKTKGEKNE